LANLNDHLEAKLGEVARWPEVHSSPHFEKLAFKRNGKIFLTIDAKNETWCVKLSTTDQSLFCLIDRLAIYPVPNRWGQKGWTHILPVALPEQVLNELLLTAWKSASRKRQ